MHNLINNINEDVYQHEIEILKNNLTNSESSRKLTYCNIINKNLAVHEIYLKIHVIPEFHRIAFTRFRVSSHSLAVETGRWNRKGRGRLPMEERLCSCGEIQNEVHVMSQCPLSQYIRDAYEFSSIDDLMSGQFSDDILCKIIYEILKVYE